MLKYREPDPTWMCLLLDILLDKRQMLKDGIGFKRENIQVCPTFNWFLNIPCRWRSMETWLFHSRLSI